ncbi:MAG: tetratricopeptide repeat protein [Alphaproteobacteria bacterium]
MDMSEVVRPSQFQSYLETIDAGTKNLFDSICQCVNKKSAQDVRNSEGELPDKWDGSVLKDFFYSSKFPLLEAIDNHPGIKKGTFDAISRSGIGEDNLGWLFFLLARELGRTIEEHLYHFILHCDNNNYTPKGFLGHENTTEDILKKFGNPILRDDQLSPDTVHQSLQDTVALNNEIDALKEVLGIYPCKKDQFLSFSSESLIDAEKRLNSLLTIYCDNFELLLIKAYLLLRQNNNGDALELSRKLIDKYSEDNSIHVLHSECLLANTCFDETLEFNFKAIETYPENPVFLNSLAVCHTAAGKNIEATDYFNKAIAADNTYLMPYIFQITFLGQKGKLKEADAVAKTGLERLPNNSHLMFYRYFLDQFESTQERSGILSGLAKSGKLSLTPELINKFIGTAGNNENQDKLVSRLLNEVNSNPNASNTDKAVAHFNYGLYYFDLFMKSLKQKEFIVGTEKSSSYALFARECFQNSYTLLPSYFQAMLLDAELSVFLNEYSRVEQCLDNIYDAMEKLPIKPYPSWRPYIQIYESMSKFTKDRHLEPLYWLLEKDDKCIFGYASLIYELLDNNKMDEALDNYNTAIDLLEGGYSFATKEELVSMLTFTQCALMFYERDGDEKHLNHIFIIIDKISTEDLRAGDEILYARFHHSEFKALNTLGRSGDTQCFMEVITKHSNLNKGRVHNEDRTLWMLLSYEYYRALASLWTINGNVEYANSALSTVNDLIIHSDSETLPDAVHLFTELVNTFTASNEVNNDILSSCVSMYQQLLNRLSKQTGNDRLDTLMQELEVLFTKAKVL